jgi:hypothetical protein
MKAGVKIQCGGSEGKNDMVITSDSYISPTSLGVWAVAAEYEYMAMV